MAAATIRIEFSLGAKAGEVARMPVERSRRLSVNSIDRQEKVKILNGAATPGRPLLALQQVAAGGEIVSYALYLADRLMPEAAEQPFKRAGLKLSFPQVVEWLPMETAYYPVEYLPMPADPSALVGEQGLTLIVKGSGSDGLRAPYTLYAVLDGGGGVDAQWCAQNCKPAPRLGFTASCAMLCSSVNP